MKMFEIKIRRRLLTSKEFSNSCLQGTGELMDSTVLRMKLESFLEGIIKCWSSRGLGSPL